MSLMKLKKLKIHKKTVKSWGKMQKVWKKIGEQSKKPMKSKEWNKVSRKNQWREAKCQRGSQKGRKQSEKLERNDQRIKKDL